MNPVGFTKLLRDLFENLSDESDFCEDTLGKDPEDFEGVEVTSFKDYEGIPNTLKERNGVVIEFQNGKSLCVTIEDASDFINPSESD